MQQFILTLSCQDKVGLVADVTAFLAQRGNNIIDSAQFGDRDTGLFFMRLSFAPGGEGDSVDKVRAGFAPIGEKYAMDWSIADSAVKPRVLIMVSRFGHCLNDLLYRFRVGALDMEIPAIVSNHRDFYQLAASYDVPYHHIPVGREAEGKAKAEDRLLDLIAEERIDLVVLARYM